MKRLSRLEKARREWIGRDEFDLRNNWPRRLRNALLALANSDQKWMIWVEREVNLRWDIQRITRLVEARARALYLKHYPDLNRTCLIFRDTPFSDTGALKPG